MVDGGLLGTFFQAKKLKRLLFWLTLACHTAKKIKNLNFLCTLITTCEVMQTYIVNFLERKVSKWFPHAMRMSLGKTEMTITFVKTIIHFLQCADLEQID